MRRLIAFCVAILVSLSIVAHPGHGVESQPVLHYVVSWWHALPVLLTLIILYQIFKPRKVKA